ncbi:beta-ketoacyl-ACP synthase 3 [Streptomyces sp. MNP-20]|uniref:beta-ketoacyl-ACP synthase 3 n=1 Tax=Streptomyces sp. MNP-20 TaxID=2721165 RepID=UPI0020A6AFD3|nr:beta-ketoacyl-ACP synthase 3 [Streptomyces sp. MNP-20]
MNPAANPAPSATRGVMHPVLSGVGAALPSRVIGNDHFLPLDATDAWITRRTGIRTRHRLGPGETLADLAERAAREALADAGRHPHEVDHVLVCTITPDRITPGIAPELAARLGADGPPAIDLNAACSGFVYALDHACALVETGRAGCVLVCAAEALSRITDHHDRSTAVLFGDAAGAVVVTAHPTAERPVFLLGSDGRHTELLYADRDERLLRMEGREVFEFAVDNMTEQTRKVLGAGGIGLDDVDLFIGHQANARILLAVAAELGLPDARVEIAVDSVGNTSSASIPHALWQARERGRLPAGARIVMAAFGAGFVWGAGLMRWKTDRPQHDRTHRRDSDSSEDDRMHRPDSDGSAYDRTHHPETDSHEHDRTHHTPTVNPSDQGDTPCQR